MKLPRFLATLIAGTALGALGQRLFGVFRMLLESVAGAAVGLVAAVILATLVRPIARMLLRPA